LFSNTTCTKVGAGRETSQASDPLLHFLKIFIKELYEIAAPEIVSI
jgi:hypothetical protein